MSLQWVFQAKVRTVYKKRIHASKSGTKALYRNKIDMVAKFFEDKYSDERNIDYMIYNLCSEMEYDHRKFHGNVKRFEVRKN